MRSAAVQYRDFISTNHYPTLLRRGEGGEFQRITLGIGRGRRCKEDQCNFSVNLRGKPAKVFITENRNLSGRTVSAAGYNFGGGLTYRVPFHHAKVYVEGRYHHANTDDLRTSVFPVSFGLRW